MSQPNLKCPDFAREILDQCGLPWRLEKGKRHMKVYVGNRMASVLSYGTSNGKMEHHKHEFRRDVNRCIAKMRAEQ